MRATSAPAGGATGAAAGTATTTPAWQRAAVKVGALVDRSGVAANLTNAAAAGLYDWVEYANATNLAGRRMEWTEFDTASEAPRAEQGYKRFVEQERVAALFGGGTQTAVTLSPKAAEDRVPLVTPGFGISAVEDAARYPYTFVGVASYHAQAMALLGHLRDQWQDTARRPRLGYVYLDNATGRDPLDLIRAQAPALGFDLVAAIAVPPTATDLTLQFLELKQRDADCVLVHLLGAHPSLALRAARQVGFPSDRMYGFAWAASETDIELAGAEAAEGYHGVLFAAVKEDDPEALRRLRNHWAETGATRDEKRIGVYYLRGVLVAALITEAIRLAGDGARITGEDVRRGFESIKDFTVYGLSPATTLTPADHAGSRKVRLYQVRTGRLSLERDWFEGPRPS